MKSIIYYTDNRLREPIFSIVQKHILESGLPIVSCSLKPICFGRNIVLDLPPGITTLNKQILTALEASEGDYIFFCEHDVLYHKSHFDFEPSNINKSYYNVNVWRWDYPRYRFITYDYIRSLSGLCISRELALRYYRERIALIERMGWKDTSREPHWSRTLGHEPGRVGNSLPAEIFEYWRSEYPNVDIRHGATVTKSKTYREDFKHPPAIETWKETSFVEGWNIDDFNRCTN